MIFKIIQINIRGLQGKTRLLNNLVLQHNADFILLNEIKPNAFYSLNSLTQLSLLPGYKLHYESGRTGIMYRTDTGAVPQRYGLDLHHEAQGRPQEVHVAGIKIPHYTEGEALHLLSVYRPPSPDPDTLTRFLDWINNSLGNKTNVLIAGDLNCRSQKWGDTEATLAGRYLTTYLENSTFFLLNNGEATRQDSILDLTIASAALQPYVANWSVKTRPQLSDHHHVHFQLERAPDHRQRIIRRWATRAHPQQWFTFQDLLIAHTRYQGHLTPEENARALTSSILKCAEFALGRVELHERRQPWWNNNLEHLKRAKRSLKRRAKRATARDNQPHAEALTQELQKVKRVLNRRLKKRKQNWRQRISTFIKKADLSQNRFWKLASQPRQIVLG